jgi:hypothetical protein
MKISTLASSRWLLSLEEPPKKAERARKDPAENDQYEVSLRVHASSVFQLRFGDYPLAMRYPWRTIPRILVLQNKTERTMQDVAA